MNRLTAKTRNLALVLAAVVLGLGNGCGTGKVKTAQQLAAALKREGVDFQTTEPVAAKLKFARIDEAITLKGNELWVEIYRIEDERSFKTATAAVMLRRAFDRSGEDQGSRAKGFFSRRPFLVTITAEPTEGMVKEVLNRILPAGK